MSTLYNKPEDILLFRMLSQKASLELEIKGLRKKGRTMYSMIKQEYNLKGSRESVLEQFGNFRYIAPQAQLFETGKDRSVSTEAPLI